MDKPPRPISLAGSDLSDVRHVCALFHDDEEEYRVLLPFIRDGIECGDRAVHIVRPDQQEDHIQRLSSAGVDTEAAVRRGQFEIRSNIDTYLREGRFDPEKMLQSFKHLSNADNRNGFPLTRFVCRMDWAAGGNSVVDGLLEFESRVNDVWRMSNDAVICSYRLDQFSGDAIIDVVRTHPFVVIGGMLRRNPFFVPPEQFLPEFRQRRRTAIAPMVD